MARRRGRIDSDRRLLALKFVYCTDARPRKALLNFEDLRVVGRNNDDVIERNRFLVFFAIDPACVACKDCLHESADRLRLFR